MAPRGRLTSPDKERLMNAVNAVPIMQDPHQRQLVVEELMEELGSEFDPARFQGSSFDNWSIVRTCISHNAVPHLVTMLRLLGGASYQWHQLNAVVREMFSAPALETATRDEISNQIMSLLQTVTTDALVPVLSHPVLQGRIPFENAEVSNGAEAYERLDALSTDGGRRTLILFLELTAHQLAEYDMVELHRLIDDFTAEADDRTAGRELCQSLGRQPRTGAAVSEESDSEQLNNPTLTGDSTLGDESVHTSQGPTVESEVTSPTPPALWGGVPPRNNNFTGREDLLDQVHRALNRHQQSALIPQPLHGLGGVGKSQMAVEFAYRYQFCYQLVWWIQADDEQSIRRSLVSLARRLGLPESEDVQDTVDTALDALRRGRSHSTWLLIYDNAPEPSVVHPYLPSGQGHVLITSRSRSWATEANAIEVDVFSPDESTMLLRARWQELTDQDALALAERLGHLPLALEQAVAAHTQTGMQLAEYLGALHTNPATILNEGTPASYPRSVAETFGLAFTSLRKHSPTAAYLLELCAFLSSQPIAISLLARGRGAQLRTELQSLLRDDVPLRRAIRDLGRYALVQLDPARDFIRIHNLVRAVLRDSIPPEQRDAIERQAHTLLALANPGQPDSPATWAQHAQIAPHVVPSGLVYSSDPEARHVVLDQIRYNYAIGDYVTSCRLGQSAVDIWRASMGPDDELTLVASRHLANSLRALGEIQAARDLNLDTLDRMVRTLGKDHEHSLATANSVAADLRLLGHFKEALRLDEENLARHQRVLGDDDPSTLRVKNNLAVDYRLLGDFQRALELDKVSIATRANVYGEEHPQTLFAYTRLIRDLYGLGEYHKGLALIKEKLPMFEQKLPKDHGNLLRTRRVLSMLLRKAGHNGPALHEAEQVYDAQRRKSGQLHEHTLSALMTLSNAHRTFGAYEMALRHGENALASYREVFRDQHPFTLACKANVAIVLLLLGHSDQALALNEEALDGFRSVLGEDHPHTLCCANNKANALAVDGRIDEALSLGQQTLERSRQLRGENHPDTLACAANVALDLDAAGDTIQASTLRKETLERLRRQLGSDHPETIHISLDRRADCDIEVSSA
ncbi:MAG: FxSxx-COOH system tetratricopeptide repeat protein [Actinomycetota bacterium]|nr:FxSxx-COOH system tetratricopeptide repeat protein [Actinomycetota bacterium]